MKTPVRRILRRAGSPLTRYLDRRFDGLTVQVQALSDRVSSLSAEPADPVDLETARRARILERVDVSDHNRGGRPPRFDASESCAVSAAQCVDPAYIAWFRLLRPGWLEEDLAGRELPERIPDCPSRLFDRKAWEWAYIAEAASRAGHLAKGRRALGFGVGNEPLPALFASRGMDVVATDQAPDSGQEWAATGELMSGLAGLSQPHLLSDAELTSKVTVRAVDMNAVPGDLGSFDLIWSSCAIEHLGSPERGLDFVIETCRMLKPGGIAVHTTELELTHKQESADYGNCAVYRHQDLVAFTERVRQLGFESSINTYVSMDTPQDRWMNNGLGTGYAKLNDFVHIKLVLFDSVTTSFGLLVRRPA